MIYVVKPGDTLLSISRRFGIPTQEVARLNQLENPNMLAVGQALLLLYRTPSGAWSVEANGYAYPSISQWQLSDSLQQLNGMAVFSYGFLADGTLLPPPLDDRWMVEEAAKQGARAALVLTPFGADGKFDNGLIGALLDDPAAQERLLHNIHREMEEKGYGELNLDFEFIQFQDRRSYVEFAALAKELLPYPVTVCLAPKISRDQKGLLYEGKDYQGLGKVADKVMLMTYEWGYTFSQPMAVAPLHKVEAVLNYALTEIPPEKILLGLANYGYDWPKTNGQRYCSARTIGNVEAAALAGEKGAEIMFDAEAQSPWFRYKEKGILHEVWFEDVRSWQGKLSLVNRYRLAGVSVWQIMRPFRAGLSLLGENFRCGRD